MTHHDPIRSMARANLKPSSGWIPLQRSLRRLFPYVILRPTGVYGPRERDYFLMAKSIKQHSDFAVGFKQQDITFVYVLDVVQAVFLACEKGQTGRKYFLSDGEVYQSATFSNLIRKELGNPWWIRITAPIWVLAHHHLLWRQVGPPHRQDIGPEQR